MHPLFSEPRRLLAYLALLAATGAGLGALAARFGSVGWGAALAFSIPFAVFFGMLLLSDYSFAPRWREGKYPRPLLPIMVIGRALIVGYVCYGLAQAWSVLLEWASDSRLVFPISPQGGLLFLAAGVGASMLSMLAHELLRAIEAMHVAERRVTESLLHAREAELRMLRSQINPHFLFNSLNSISALTSVNPAGAREMAIALAQFFRHTVALAEHSEIPLSEELDLIENYLAVEKVRFGDRLNATLEVDDLARQALIPPLMLQPLVENAIKHGIRDRVDGGTIRLRGTTRGGWLYLAVENPGAERKTSAPGSGLGLKNIRQRLASRYAERARMTWRDEGGHFTVELTLPFESERP